MTPVKSQGQCGACYAFATTALTESLYKQKFKTDLNLSEQEIINCSPDGSIYSNSGCDGGYINKSLDYIAAKGMHLETADPYVSARATCKNLPAITTAAAANSAGVRVANVREVGRQSLLDLLNALQTAPVAVAIYVPLSLYDYKSGLYTAASCLVKSTGDVPLNHAVLAVGYSLTGDATTGNKPYILIKNSWGTTWGEQGYFKLEMTLVDQGNGPCNITFGGYNYTATLN